MIDVVCKTNLDLHNERWPDQLPAVPNVGDIIMSATKWGVFQLTLEVHGVYWEPRHAANGRDFYWKPIIELHIPKYKKWSITEFYQWYAPLIGKRVSFFI